MEEEFSIVTPEDCFGEMLDAGHGVQMVPELVEWKEGYKDALPPLPQEERELNLDPRKCPHRMVRVLPEEEEEWEQECTPTLYEQVCPTEAGPWEYTYENEDGDTITLGYEGTVDTVEMMPPRWEAEELGHEEAQEEIHSLEEAVENAVVHSTVRELVEERTIRFARILWWLGLATKEQKRQAKGRFWKKLVSSRSKCSKTGLWFHVWLTKAQVDQIKKIW